MIPNDKGVDWAQVAEYAEHADEHWARWMLAARERIAELELLAQERLVAMDGMSRKVTRAEWLDKLRSWGWEDGCELAVGNLRNDSVRALAHFGLLADEEPAVVAGPTRDIVCSCQPYGDGTMGLSPSCPIHGEQHDEPSGPGQPGSHPVSTRHGTSLEGMRQTHSSGKDAGGSPSLAQRLRACCDGHPYAKIPWPHRILHEAADALEAKPSLTVGPGGVLSVAWRSCPVCGTDAMCDVCHEHDEPRGECSECPDVIEDEELFRG